MKVKNENYGFGFDPFLFLHSDVLSFTFESPVLIKEGATKKRLKFQFMTQKETQFGLSHF